MEHTRDFACGSRVRTADLNQEACVEVLPPLRALLSNAVVEERVVPLNSPLRARRSSPRDTVPCRLRANTGLASERRASACLPPLVNEAVS